MLWHCCAHFLIRFKFKVKYLFWSPQTQLEIVPRSPGLAASYACSTSTIHSTSRHDSQVINMYLMYYDTFCRNVRMVCVTTTNVNVSEVCRNIMPTFYPGDVTERWDFMSSGLIIWIYLFFCQVTGCFSAHSICCFFHIVLKLNCGRESSSWVQLRLDSYLVM